MPWVHPDVLDNGISEIRDNCTAVLAVVAAAVGANYATVTGGSNVLASLAREPGDFSLSTPSTTSNRRITSAAGQDPEADAGGTANHFAFIDASTSRVLWVTEVANPQSIAQGNPVNFPSLSYTSNQPTAE